MIYKNLSPDTLKNKKIIHSFRTGDYLVYFHHKFDDFCVALIKDGQVDIPQDKEYFKTIKRLGRTLGEKRTYSLFLRVWLLVSKGMTAPNEAHWDYIEKWTWEYLGERTDLFDITFETMCILYVAMISEENHLYGVHLPPLGKDVKKIGIYQVLMEDFSPSAAADYTKKMAWRDMAKISRSHNVSFGLPKRLWRANGFS